MIKSQRELLIRTMEACGKMGGVLDATATAKNKYRDRQSAHATVSKIIYLILMINPENDNMEEDKEEAFLLVSELELLAKKEYKDIYGN